MSRAVNTTLLAASVGVALVFTACSGGGDAANPIVKRQSACALFAQLSETGQTVAHADVGDPATFNATLRAAVTQYVRITGRLRAVVPSRLRSDIDRLTAAAKQYRFDEATAARAVIDEYAHSTCGSNRSSG